MVEQIEHVVVLMLENRSFDHMLGCFQQIYPGLNGIDPGAPARSNPNIVDIPVLQAPGAERVLANDPKHETRDVLVWQLRDANNSTIPQSSSSIAGEALFSQLGCTGCHTPSLTTAADPTSFIPPSTGGTPISSAVNKALSKQTFHPYSDFLLHSMGSLGDGITSGSAGPTMMRTPPLWGIRAKSFYLHDGRASDLSTAISLHDGQGKAAAQAFQALSTAQQNDLVNFLDTL
jgi:CxxC motif-containing protein (DUF1111 family)